MERRHHLRSFANRRGKTLDGAGSNVSHREDTAHTGLKRITAVPRKRLGADKTLRVHFDSRLREPPGIGSGANQQKQVANRPHRFLASRSIYPANALECAV